MNNDNQLDILAEETSGLDQPINVNPFEVYRQVDAVMESALQNNNPEYALDYGYQLVQASRISGLGLARLCGKLNTLWSQFKADEDFTDAAYKSWGLSRATITRYIHVYEMLTSPEIPQEIRESLEQRPIRDLIQIGTTVASGFPISDDQWKGLVEAPDQITIRNALLDIRNEEPRPRSIILRMSRDGSLYAWSDKQRYFIGYLEIELAKDEPVIDKSITRILKAVGISVE